MEENIFIFRKYILKCSFYSYIKELYNNINKYGRMLRFIESGWRVFGNSLYCFGDCSVNLTLSRSKKLDQVKTAVQGRLNKAGRYSGSGPGDQEEEETTARTLYGQLRQMKHCLLRHRQKQKIVVLFYQSEKPMLFFLPNKITWIFPVRINISIWSYEDISYQALDVHEWWKTRGSGWILEAHISWAVVPLSLEHGRWSLQCTTSGMERCNSSVCVI